MNIFHGRKFMSVSETADGIFRAGVNGVADIFESKDKKIQIVYFSSGKILIGIITRKSFTTYYPMGKPELEYPIKAVLMDLDGTTLYSEFFWINVIEKTIRKASGNVNLFLKEEDYPFVSGHSVSEHLQYCISHFGLACSLQEALSVYYDLSRRELDALVHGETGDMRIQPAYYLKDFLTHLREKGIKIGLVSSGLYEKAYPEIKYVCNELDLGQPENFYHSIITAGSPLKEHQVGTLGELSAKPHPWLYLETAIVGMGLSFEDRKNIIGIEDSGAGICALCAAGIPAVGIRSGNIEISGMENLCMRMCEDLKDIEENFFVKIYSNSPELFTM